MDARAKQAVKSAIEKAEFCKVERVAVRFCTSAILDV